MHYLVYFQEEGTVSLADERQFAGDAHNIGVGDTVHIKYGRKKYQAVVKAKGRTLI